MTQPGLQSSCRLPAQPGPPPGERTGAAGNAAITHRAGSAFLPSKHPQDTQLLLPSDAPRWTRNPGVTVSKEQTIRYQKVNKAKSFKRKVSFHFQMNSFLISLTSLPLFLFLPKQKVLPLSPIGASTRPKAGKSKLKWKGTLHRATKENTERSVSRKKTHAYARCTCVWKQSLPRPVTRRAKSWQPPTAKVNMFCPPSLHTWLPSSEVHRRGWGACLDQGSGLRAGNAPQPQLHKGPGPCGPDLALPASGARWYSHRPRGRTASLVSLLFFFFFF